MAMGSDARQGLPTIPTSSLSGIGRTLRENATKDLESLQEQLIRAKEGEGIVNSFVNSTFRRSNLAVHYLTTGLVDLAEKEIASAEKLIDEELAAVDEACWPSGVRQDRISQSLEVLLSAKALLHFFNTGKLLRKANLGRACFKDAEYLGGAMRLCQLLNKYAIGQASDLDVKSVELCRTLTDELNAACLQFDFRNGPLRLKYDGIKYDLKRLDDILYELSLVIEPAKGDESTVKELGQGRKKRARVTPPEEEQQPPPGQHGKEGGEDGLDFAAKVVDTKELDEIRLRMVEFDAMRETVIKRSRDMQKLGKQAIYSLHRGDEDKASKQLDECVAIYRELEPIISADASLRQGSLTNALEEWAEGKLYQIWLADTRLVTMKELEICNTGEYMGGLFDLTGEINRYAVAQATKRRADKVKECLETVTVISEFVSLATLPPKLGKKEKELKRSLSKLQSITYELALKKAGKGSVGGVSGGETGGEPREDKDDGMKDDV